jgi:hypothetical protein
MADTPVNVVVQNLGEVQGSTPRRWLWFVLGGLGVVVVFVIGWLVLRKSPIKAAAVVIDAVAAKVDAIDAQARVDTAIAAGVQAEQVKKVEEAAKIKDPVARAEAFAVLAKEDY